MLHAITRQAARTRVLVTGASGFVGRHVTEELAQRPGYSVRGALRKTPPPPECPAIDYVAAGQLSPDADWTNALRDIDVVVHLAARVHLMRDPSPDPLAAFRRANVDGTLALARQAAAAGVRRFVFVSSIKVNGERTVPGKPFKATDAPAPCDPYGTSKLEAEQGLQALSASTGIEYVIIRPPLVYGPGVGANFLAMMRWLRRGVPLPLGGVRNKRSLVSVHNLSDLIVTCVDHPAAANQILLVADGEDLSTAEMLQRLGVALGCPARLIPVPPNVLRVGSSLIGKSDIARRLCDSLQVDVGPTRDLLRWCPPVSVDQGLQSAARYFLAHQVG